MRARTIVLILLVVALGGGTVFLINQWLSQQEAALRAQRPAPEREAPQVRVLVASERLAPGHFLRPSDVRWQVWPNGDVPNGYIREGGNASPEQLVGAVLRDPARAGEPITLDQIVRPGDHGFLAAVLWPGMRAVSVPVTAESGVSGFVFPGDRVDLILTRTVRVSRGGVSMRSRSSETVLENVRVIAVDQSANERQEQARVPDTVTIELTRRQTEMITLARQMGTLSLALRSLSPESERDVARRTSEARTGKRGEFVLVGQSSATDDQSAASSEEITASNGEPTARHVLPNRGQTITRDFEVSRMVTGDAMDERTKEVVVVRGSTTQNLVMKNGRLSDSSQNNNESSNANESSNNESDNETESGNEN